MDSQECDFENMLEASLGSSKQLTLGDKLEATVISIGKDYVFLDLGDRSEGLLFIDEVKGKDGALSVAVGQQLKVFITAFKDGASMCGLRMGSPKDRHDDNAEALGALKDAFEAKMPVEGTVKESIKGGFSLTVMGQRAFCPISQIDNKYCDNPELHLGQTYDFEIIKFEESGRNIVVSRRNLLEAEAEEKAAQLWDTIQPDNTYDGIVSSLRAYGAFVDIGGIEGLLHVSEIAYDRVTDPKDVLEVGQQIKVAVKDIDREQKRISLSLKALMDDPWDGVATTLKTNQTVKGRVVRLQRFGVFVELTPGIEGLVHISEMDSEKHIQNPREVVHEGQEITVRILSIDPDQKRISLTMKTETTEENWAADLQESRTNAPQNDSFGTFGDLLKDKLKD